MRYSSSRTFARRARVTLMASVVGAGFPLAAQAQTIGPKVDAVMHSPHKAGAPEYSIHDPQIVITPPETPTTALDPDEISGVGQMVTPNGDGTVGLCTGTLVNPRMVIFAAHCVNDLPQEAYGTQAGDRAISFGFKANNLPAVRDWLFGNTATGVQAFRSTPANALYNVNQIRYNPASLEPESRSFLYGDVAVASLDTPAANVPAWALLFSPLPAPGTIDGEAGTGYHVINTGYGRNGVATTGDTNGIDFRRRSAENYIGALASLDDVDLFLFGEAGGLPQNLYMTDMDDPRRGTDASSPFDFNLFKDNALPREGTTAGGDSGGPLILDRAFDKPVVIGVLSGGSRYFNAQPSSSYGTSSFYQPLYLYWNYIAENNPYRYVGSRAGNGNWTDPNHWVTQLDPAYQVLVNGQLVNGIPTSLGEETEGAAGKFGQICFEDPDVSQCYDLATDTLFEDGVPVVVGTGEGVPPAANIPLPGATLANGLPGATGFVPNNTDPNRATGAVARYFDVTLAEAGTTTLDSTATIDRLSIAGSAAQLAVTGTGRLNSLIEVNHLDGRVHVDGTLATAGDYFLRSGMLSGSGRINTPFLTSVLGMVAPGAVGTVGTLTVGGNVILSSGSTLLIDVGANGTSDRLAVVRANGTGGQANVGGTVAFAPATGSTIRFGDNYTIVTAEGGITGSFTNSPAISAILRPEFTYGANSVSARITAASYFSVIENTPVQRAYAQLLDQGRVNYAGLQSVYEVLDLQSAGTIRASLESWAPATETAKRALGTAALDNAARFYRERLAAMDASKSGGDIAMIGQPVQLAALATTMPGTQATASDTSSALVRQGALPDNVSAYLAGGYIDGSSAPMAGTAVSGGRDQFDGYYIAGGIEAALSDSAMLGFGLSYTDLDSDVAPGQSADGNLVLGTLYGKIDDGTGLVFDVQASAGRFQANTQRNVALVGTDFALRSRDNALALSSEVGAAYLVGDALRFGPRVAMRASRVQYTVTPETGGGPALVYNADKFDSAQARAGGVLQGRLGALQPHISAYYVHDFKDRPGVFSANFLGGSGPFAVFPLSSQDQDWGEVTAGVTYATGNVDFTVSADSSFERDDVRNQSYRATVRVKF